MVDSHGFVGVAGREEGEGRVRDCLPGSGWGRGCEGCKVGEGRNRGKGSKIWHSEEVG